jgi:hypothetical protein
MEREQFDVLEVRFSQGWLRSVQSYGMWLSLLWKFTDVLEGHTASIFRLEKWTKQVANRKDAEFKATRLHGFIPQGHRCEGWIYPSVTLEVKKESMLGNKLIIIYICCYIF